MGNSSSSTHQKSNPVIDEQHMGYGYSISSTYLDHSHYDTQVVCDLIQKKYLCPFYGDQSSSKSEEECPICFSELPSYNTTTCCKSNICTDCFVQMKPMDLKEQIGCPFCNSKPLSVKYEKSSLTYTDIRDKHIKNLHFKEYKKQQREKQLNYQMNMINQMNMLRDLSLRAESPQDLDDVMLKMALEESLKPKRTNNTQ
eukprot:NODE_19_length_47148_cov_1.447810.p31 type:complete len:199 gc:universal NODE_19_length_47148_cov_1.447810:37837-38433(+)